MLSEALAFPRRGEDWLVTILLGGVLTLLSFLVIPALFINGYGIRVFRAAIEGDETPPQFDDWVDLLVDGVLVWVVELVYLGVPTLLLLLVLVPFFVVTSGSSAAGMPPQTGSSVGALVGTLVFVVAVLLLVLAAYLLPAALANFARTGEVTAAFALRTVVRGAFSGDYLVAVLLVIVVAIVLGAVAAALSVVLVGVFVLFYLQVVVYHLIGQGFARGLGLDPGAPETAEVG